MTDNWSLGAISRAVLKAFRDVAVNAAPKPAVELTGAQIAASLTSLQARLPAIIAAMKAYQGVIAGVEDVLDALSSAGIPYAAQVEAGLEAAPNALAQAQSWLPWVLPFLNGGYGERPLDSDSPNFREH